MARMKTTEVFVKEAKVIWGDRNDYSSTRYLGAKVNVDITCRKHNFVFQQSPQGHLKGKNGCPECKKENRPEIQEKMALARRNSKKWRQSMIDKRKYQRGHTQGRLTVIKRLAKSALCECDCGSEKEISIQCLSAGVQSCGCLWIDAQRERRVYRVGYRRGRLEVIEELDNNNVLCKCECGKTKEVTRASLVAGTGSCGCAGGTWRGYEEIPQDYFRRIEEQRNRYARGKKVVPFKATMEELWDLYISQDRRCALTGWKIYFKSRKRDKVQRDQTASLDRIDSNGIYEIGNVQWVHVDMQCLKWDLPDDVLIEWCKKVRDHHEIPHCG